jgi:FKBP-type peptidyl-prolyl cis-trans isomerase SlyD
MMSEPTQVADQTVVSLEYVLHLGDGKVIDQSSADDPLEYLQGHGNIIPGLEKAVAGMVVGEEKEVVVPPAEAYGERDPEDVVGVPRNVFPAKLTLAVGEPLMMKDSQSGETLRAYVSEIKADEVVLDFNHPLAGKTLFFKVKIARLRLPTSEELEHGHVHSAGHTH